jgi:hypothetical protein
MHNLRFIQRRFPDQAGTIIGTLTLLSLSALAVGIGLLMLT